MYQKIRSNPVFFSGLLWMIAGFLYSMHYIMVHGRVALFSDVSAEMLLADLCNSEHGLLSENWFYSTELRVFYFNTLLQLGLFFSPHNWFHARIIASCLEYILAIAVFFFYAKSIGMKKYAPWVMGFLFWPCSDPWLNFNVLYLFNILLCLLILGVVNDLHNKKSPVTKAVLIACGFVIALVSGLNGPKLLFSFYAPFLISYTICLILSVGDQQSSTLKEVIRNCKTEFIRFLLAAGYTMTNGIGFLINKNILSRKYTYSDYSASTIWLENRTMTYDTLLDRFIRMFGYSSGPAVVSVEGISVLLGLFLGLFIVMTIIWCLANVRKLDRDERTVASLAFSGFFFCFFIFCYMEGYSDWHWMIQYPFLIMALFLVIKKIDLKAQVFETILMLCFGISVCLISRNTVNTRINTDLYLGAADQVLVTDYLVSENVEQGIAMAWSAQKIEELSSGKVEMWVVNSYSQDFMPAGWLQKKSHMMPPANKEKCAVVIADLEVVDYPGGLEGTDIVKYGNYLSREDIGTIHVFIFQNYDEIADAFKKGNAERAAMSSGN